MILKVVSRMRQRASFMSEPCGEQDNAALTSRRHQELPDGGGIECPDDGKTTEGDGIMFRLLLRSWVCFPVREDQSRILASIISL